VAMAWYQTSLAVKAAPATQRTTIHLRESLPSFPTRSNHFHRQLDRFLENEMNFPSSRELRIRYEFTVITSRADKEILTDDTPHFLRFFEDKKFSLSLYLYSKV
jgi:hypothetical protein